MASSGSRISPNGLDDLVTGTLGSASKQGPGAPSRIEMQRFLIKCASGLLCNAPVAAALFGS